MLHIDHPYEFDASLVTRASVGFRSLLAHAIYMHNADAIERFVAHNLVISPVRSGLIVTDNNAWEIHTLSYALLYGETSVLKFSRHAKGNNHNESVRALLGRNYDVLTRYAGGLVSFHSWDRHIPTARNIVPDTIDIYTKGENAFK